MRHFQGERIVDALKVALCLGCATWAASVAALEPAAANAAREIDEELKVEDDPTILKRRVWLDSEWSRFKDDSNEVDETLGALWAWRASPDQDWAVRVKVPINSHLAGDDAADSSEHGLGDVKLATGTAYRFGERLRAGGGLELRTPTAHDSLGNDAWQVQAFGAIAWDASEVVSVSPSFEYNRSFSEEHGARSVNYLEMFFPATFLLPRQMSTTVRYEAKVDFEHHNFWTHSAKLSLAKRFIDSPLGATLSLKRSFDSGEKKFQLNLIATYYFAAAPRTP